MTKVQQSIKGTLLARPITKAEGHSVNEMGRTRHGLKNGSHYIYRVENGDP